MLKFSSNLVGVLFILIGVVIQFILSEKLSLHIQKNPGYQLVPTLGSCFFLTLGGIFCFIKKEKLMEICEFIKMTIPILAVSVGVIYFGNNRLDADALNNTLYSGVISFVFLGVIVFHPILRENKFVEDLNLNQEAVFNLFLIGVQFYGMYSLFFPSELMTSFISSNLMLLPFLISFMYVTSSMMGMNTKTDQNIYLDFKKKLQREKD